MDPLVAGTTTFLEDFLEDRLIKSFSVLRGQARRNAPCAVVPRAPKGETTGAPDFRRRARPPPASGHALQSAPSASRRPPGEPVPASCSAGRSGLRAPGSFTH